VRRAASDEGSEVERDTGAADGAPPGSRVRRRPYEPPRIESGLAFERVQLASGCNFSDPLECDPVCV
jgi:hypothetical protein